MGTSSTLSFPAFKLTREQALFVVLLFTGLAGSVFVFSQAYLSNMNVVIGALLFPFSLHPTGERRNNLIFMTAIVMLASLAFIYGVRIAYFFALGFYVLWIVELFIGRVSMLALFLLFFMSPFFVQVVTILGFPIRLGLSDYAGSLLAISGVNVTVDGNMMLLDGATFTVDDACMGLNMLAISMLMGAFSLSYQYHSSAATLGPVLTVMFFLIALVLNMLTNLVRIIVLVYFKILPGQVMHDVVGLLCLIGYVLVPLYFLSRWMVGRYGHVKRAAAPIKSFKPSYAAAISILSVLLLCAGAVAEFDRPHNADEMMDVRYGDLKRELLADGVTKLYDDDLLIYVKAIPEFFTGEHTPLMCWKGSGYSFSGIATKSVAGRTIYKGTLVKEGNILHTAWWYSNGEVETISQLDWRMRMLKGEKDFALVNVTASGEEELMKAVKNLLDNSFQLDRPEIFSKAR